MHPKNAFKTAWETNSCGHWTFYPCGGSWKSRTPLLGMEAGRSVNFGRHCYRLQISPHLYNVLNSNVLYALRILSSNKTSTDKMIQKASELCCEGRKTYLFNMWYTVIWTGLALKSSNGDSAFNKVWSLSGRFVFWPTTNLAGSLWFNNWSLDI